MNFFDADGLAGKDRTEVNFLAPQADAAGSLIFSFQSAESSGIAVLL
jgi:hypothetical protein